MTNLKRVATINALTEEFEKEILKYLKVKGYLIARDCCDRIIVYKEIKEEKEDE